MSVEGDYSEVADAQLDELEAGADADLYNAVLDTVELIFRLPGQAQSLSTAITTPAGIRMRLPVIGHPPYKVFWSTDGPRIEAIFPHP
ncbi:hypothetical protein H7I87_27200 [Mycobacterium timonense]|uniref:Uncharacterized protein n=3 Tax=Mycobacterium TaxID=1763 RepID=A0AAW5SA90_MYCBC|nr:MULTISPECIES: hypothetical protein [Mycobacterium]ETB46688.1 hypothetical protein O981_27370 [Mycobacterium avium 10-5560]MCV6991641.1 hypothetical protein [Mycobacterium bouchedurhonense]MCV6998333.1 hypothetical protein [Mycobacterium timonense]ORA47429.1 hypothetical protein BST19_18060 [Mycobacterium bouchedurhonense]ORB76778.1 hypothetical protein BST46_28190 [Mycobacterium timonense]